MCGGEGDAGASLMGRGGGSSTGPQGLRHIPSSLSHGSSLHVLLHGSGLEVSPFPSQAEAPRGPLPLAQPSSSASAEQSLA